MKTAIVLVSIQLWSDDEEHEGGVQDKRFMVCISDCSEAAGIQTGDSDGDGIQSADGDGSAVQGGAQTMEIQTLSMHHHADPAPKRLNIVCLIANVFPQLEIPITIAILHFMASAINAISTRLLLRDNKFEFGIAPSYAKQPQAIGLSVCDTLVVAILLSI